MSAVSSVVDSDTSVSTCLTPSTLKCKDSPEVAGVTIDDLPMIKSSRTCTLLPMPKQLHETDKEMEITAMNDLPSSNNSEASSSTMQTSMKDFLKSYLSLVKCNVFNHQEDESLELKRLRDELQSYTEKFKIQYEEMEHLNKDLQQEN